MSIVENIQTVFSFQTFDSDKTRKTYILKVDQEMHVSPFTQENYY